MKLKIAFIGATALGMLMATGVVYAGDANDARLWQNGNNNIAGTDQTSAHDSTIGTINNLAGQIGDNNSLSVTQVAGHNSAGTTGDGIDQQNNKNYLTIYQGYQDNPNWNPYNSIGEYMGCGGAIIP